MFGGQHHRRQNYKQLSCVTTTTCNRLTTSYNYGITTCPTATNGPTTGLITTNLTTTSLIATILTTTHPIITRLTTTSLSTTYIPNITTTSPTPHDLSSPSSPGAVITTIITCNSDRLITA